MCLLFLVLRLMGGKIMFDSLLLLMEHFLKANTMVYIFIVVFKYGDEHVLSLAYGIEDKKSEESWTLFSTKVCNILDALIMY